MEKKEKKRITAAPENGLTRQQVQAHMEQGLYNKESVLPTKSIPRIIRDNTCTLFNLINILLAIAVLCVGSYKNMLFMGIVLCNIAIGTFQEIRAKRTVDKLSIIASTKVKAVRDGQITLIGINDIVLDDVLELANGNQIPTDCIVLQGECDVNESLLTGESDPIHKKPGDTLLSGSYIISGKCRVRADHVGDENYAASIFSGAKYMKKVNSEIMRTLNKIIKIISIAIIPVGILLFLNQQSLSGTSFQTSVVNTVAALIGMIPEGLILLTSTVLAVGVIRLSKYKVLVQELYCIETLARVDVLCLDKTGTITEGSMELCHAAPLDGVSQEEVDQALTSLMNALEDDNPTSVAIREKYSLKTPVQVVRTVPFSSERKWSGVQFEKTGTYVIGAAEFLFSTLPKEVEEKIHALSNGYRVLVLARSDDPFGENQTLPTQLKPMALLEIKDRIRENAKETLAFFDRQGVELKIISGDNPVTVSGVAKEAGLKGYDRYVDATSLKTPEEIKAAAEQYSIFGRVTPVQKKDLICALKEAGHTVAMTGDGVNDVLALKEADCSVAMASGSDAARNVSQLVLLNSDFSSMPRVVAEGRRSINNIQRSAALFLVKTIYSSVLALLFLFVDFNYPFEPIQMTLINVFAIGLPSFVLALEPNHERIQGNFFLNVISRAIPAALTIILDVIFVLILSMFVCLTTEQISTLCVILTGFTGLMLIFKLSIPFNPFRIALFIVCTSGLTCGLTVFRGLFNLNPFSMEVLLIMLPLLAVSVLLFIFLIRIMDKLKIDKQFHLNL